ncbi:MAG: tripartite tricarboxylate transporter TctB family protein [Spirochaetales bacterium]|nr:tripartite tricarboxylate transporter TctB family protein [Spirochaetales bacterium]
MCFLFFIGITLFYGNAGLRFAMSEPLTPGMYGQIITITFCIACIFRLLWVNLSFFYFRKQSLKQGGGDGSDRFVIKEPFLIIFQMVLMVLYVLGITRVGYFTSMYIYLLVTIIFLTNKRNRKAIILYAAGILIFCFFLKWVFDIFYVMMPNTPLW